MQPRIWLSKSTFLRSLQCAKSLYLYKNHYQLRDRISPETLRLFQQGHTIEAEARKKLFGDGMNVRPKSPRGWTKSIQTTKLLIENGEPLIFEAAFNFEGIMCAVDVVEVKQSGLHCYEIKRGSRIKDVYLNDCALQYWVIKNAGFSVNNFSLINFQGEKDMTVLKEDDFLITSVIQQLEARFLDVEEQVQRAQRTLNYETIPDIEMGDHCHQPYDCDFIGFCSQQEKMKQNF